MFRAFFRSPEWRLWAYGGAALLFVLVVAQVVILARLNIWYGDVFDILSNYEEHTLPEFYTQLGIYCVLVFALLSPLVIFMVYFERNYMLAWRAAVTDYYAPHIEKAQFKTVGTAQRVFEDVGTFTATVWDIFSTAIESVATMIAFAPFLWELSELIELPHVGRVHGLLIWVCLAFCAIGTLISWLVGWKLASLEYKKRNIDALLRKRLEHLEDGVRWYDVVKRVKQATPVLRKRSDNLYRHYAYYGFWDRVFDEITKYLPFAIVAPAIFAGIVTIGALMKAIDGIQRFIEAGSFFIDKWVALMALKAVIKRLKELERDMGIRK